MNQHGHAEVTMTQPTPLRVGIAGAARGAGFVAGLRSVPDQAQLHAVYDPDPEARRRFATEHGAEVECESYAQLLGHADLVVVSSPQHHHVPQAVAALDAGVHVLSEVPAAVSLEQAYDLLAACRRSSARYMMAENYCYIRSNLVVREMARQGVFGELYYGEGEYLHELKGLSRHADGRPTWRYYWQHGRAGHPYPTHSLGPLLQWFGDRVAAVSCVGTGRHTAPEFELDDTVLLLCRTSRGALLRIRYDTLSNRPHLMDYYAVQGTEGGYEAARLPGGAPHVHVQGRSPAGQWEPLDGYAEEFLPARYRQPPPGAAGHWGADAWPIVEFVEAIQGETELPVDIYAALEMSLPGVVSERSYAENGAWLHVPDPHVLTAGIGTEPGREAPLA
jgi:predicted dehydrogenase